MIKKALPVLAITLYLALTTSANAQFLSACGQFLLKHVGEPLVAELAKQAGGKIADYFSNKLQQGSQTFTREDVNALGNQGVTPCELRQAMSRLNSAPPEQPASGFSAQSHCSITGATGYSDNLPTPQMALSAAINNCIYYGGVPECCAHGAMLAQ